MPADTSSTDPGSRRTGYWRSILTVVAALCIVGYASHNALTEKERVETVAARRRAYEKAAEQNAQVQQRYGEIQELVRSGDTAQLLVRLKAEPNERAAAFDYAISEGRAALVSTLLREYHAAAGYGSYELMFVGAVREPIAQTKLESACFHGYTDIARLLVVSGADANKRSAFGFPPLTTAARRGHTDTVRFLLQCGANVDEEVHLPPITRDQKLAADEQIYRLAGMTPLMLAAESRHPDVVKLLMEHGADVGHRSRAGLDALGACRKGPPDFDATRRKSSMLPKRARLLEARVASRISRAEVEGLLTPKLASTAKSPH